MAREETNKIKRKVMINIARLIPNTKVIGRSVIKTPDKFVFARASRNYSGKEKGEIRNWYGFVEDELIQDDSKNDLLLFTTGEVQYFLLIPFKNFMKEIFPYLRALKDGGHFFLISRKDNKWIIPIDYIPKELKNKIGEEGINISKYVNDLSQLGISYDDYFSSFKSEEIPQEEKLKESSELLNMTSMIKTIAEEDPTFLTKSTEEKLIIIRYHQIVG